MATVMLIDGNSLTYRAFFALPTEMATASGQVTNAVFGFTSMLINLLTDHQPDVVAVAFDRPEPTFRHRMTPTYKAQRESPPDILIQQLGIVREVLEAVAIASIDLAGFEADDIIATLATQARDRGDDVIVVTGDRDSYQLVEDPHVKVLYNKRGVSDYAFYDEAGILERTGVKPVDYVQYAALRGDPSDNLPGVPGVGEKTAAKLINERGGIDGIYAALGELSPKLRENLAAHEANVRHNVEMMRLIRDVDLPVPLAGLETGDPDPDEIKKLFDLLEFRSLWDRLVPILGGTVPDDPAEVIDVLVTGYDTAAAAVTALTVAATGTDPLAIAVPAAGVEHGLAFVVNGAAGEVGFIAGRVLLDAAVLDALRQLVGAEGRPIAMHGAKFALRQLLVYDVDVRSLTHDTRLAAYLLDSTGNRYELGDLLWRHVGQVLPNAEADEGQLDLSGGDQDRAALDSTHAALAVDRLLGPLHEAMSAQGLVELHDDLEVPLVRVLARMEHRGIGVDREALSRIRDELAAATVQMWARVVEHAGHEFNVNSSKQLAEVLFEELGLPPQQKTKTGFSTGVQTLEKLRGEHPIIEDVFEYREVQKLYSTYGEGLLAEVGPGDRIRATFNQTVARTGRLSSDAPNLHNIPVRSERGRVFRTAFVAPPDHMLLVADYNQIELRCIAHLSHDEGLIEAFEAGEDIHTATAAKVFGVAPGDVKYEQRSKAKMISYGLVYGMEAYGLAVRFNIAFVDAKEILENYFAAFPSVRAYMDATVAEARHRGYTETLFGRRRPIPELASGNRRVRQTAERQAMNSGLQGLAADIFKVALVRLDKALEEEGLHSRIVLQVHDEIIVEAPTAELDRAKALTIETMRGAFDLRVPLEVNLNVGPTWADAKG